MEQGLEEQEASPKPLAFTIDFGGGNAARYRDLSERYKKRHRRGQSLGGQPAEKSLSPEGSHSPSEDSSVSQARRRSELTLPVKGVLADSTTSLKEIPTPSPEMKPKMDLKPSSNRRSSLDVRPQLSNPNSQPTPHPQPNPKPNNSAQPSPLPSPSGGGGGEGTESDAVSDAGTYTLDAENYSEEQKARMSIDAKFRMEKEISMRQKTEQYVQSLLSPDVAAEPWRDKPSPRPSPTPGAAPSSSPVLSPTQHTMSITHTPADDEEDKVFTGIMFPSPKARSGQGLSQFKDEGSVISVTSSGAFRPRPPPPPPPAPVWATGRRHPANLSKSEVQVETYVDESSDSRKEVIHASITLNRSSVPRLTTNIINVQSISLKEGAGGLEEQLLGKSSKAKSSPTSSPTPVSRPRGGDDNTEAYLQPAVHIINSLQKRLSLDPQGAPPLNNTRLPLHHARHNSLDNNDRLPNKLEHFYAKNLQAGIDQTPPSPRLLNQYRQVTAPSTGSPIKRSSSFGIKNTNLVAAGQLKESNVRPVVSSVQRSASTAMVRPHIQVRYRGTLTSQGVDRNRYGDTEEEEEDSTTSTEEDEAEQQQQQRRKADPLITNTRYNRAFSLRRARLDVAPTTPQPKCPNTPEMRRKFPTSVTERAASVDRKPSANNAVSSRYLQGVQGKRATTEPPVGHKSGKGTNAPTNTVRPSPVLSRSDANRFSVRNSGGSKPPAGSGNSQRTNRKDPSKMNSGGTGKGKSGGPRSNSSLSSREVEFQNWKRRKSYDPMKAAAEGKRKELMAKRQQQQQSPAMTQSYTGGPLGPSQDCDSSSPSHSGSVHRSQSFHGTGASLGGPPLSSEDDDDDLTLSADEGGFSPPTPSPCELSPARTACLRTTALRERTLYSQL